MPRYSIYGSHITEINKLRHVQPHTPLKFARASDLLNLFGYLGAAHWTKINYGLTAGQLLQSSLLV